MHTQLERLHVPLITLPDLILLTINAVMYNTCELYFTETIVTSTTTLSIGKLLYVA